MTTVLDMIYRIEEMHDLPDSYETCIRFFLECLGLLEGALPEAVLAEIACAQRYWLTNDAECDLIGGKKKIWSMLENEKVRSATEKNSLRTALFIFEGSAPTSDIFELLDSFTQYLQNSDVTPSAIVSILSNHFCDSAR